MQMSLTVEERLDRIEQLLRGQKNVLNFSEACDFTGISPSYMYKLTHNARIPHYKPHGKNVYFLREELEQWLLQNPVRTAEQKDRAAPEVAARIGPTGPKPIGAAGLSTIKKAHRSP